MTPAPGKEIAQCEMLLRQAPGCAWLLNPDRSFRTVYGDCGHVFGRTAGELEGASFVDLFAPHAQPHWIRRVDRVFTGQTLSAPGRFGDIDSTWSLTLFPLSLPDGAIVFAGGMAHEMPERDLLLRLLEAQEDNRARLSRLLHDQVGQNLSAAGLQLDLLRMDLADTAFPIAARTAEIQAMLESVMAEVREINYELNPAVAERIGLRAALDRLAGRLRADFKGKLRVLTDSTVQLSPRAAAAFYRIAQEAATNATRHAGCSAIEILLKSLRSGPSLEIRDNGRGFDSGEAALGGKGLGLLLMQYHADQADIELEIESTPASGTLVRALCRTAQESA